MLDQLSALGWDQDQFLRFLDLGGPVVVILLGMSVFALAVSLTKLAHFSGLRIEQQRVVEKALSLYRSGRTRDAIRRAERSPNPAAQMLARGLNGVQRGLPQHTIREEMIRYGNAALQDLRSGLRPLEVIGSLAPLLGLFGTVLGMIDAFRALETAGGAVDPAVLSGGIWQALLTTAVGLAVAMPTVAALGWLERRVERAAEAMDDAVARVFAPALDLDLREGAPRAAA